MRCWFASNWGALKQQPFLELMTVESSLSLMLVPLTKFDIQGLVQLKCVRLGQC